MENQVVLVRLPMTLKAAITDCARTHLRSTNKEIIFAITRHLAALNTSLQSHGQ
jgi:hypothetical protein